MGNNQSSPNPHRLSKPRTNTNSLAPTLQLDSPVSVSSRYADLSAKGRQQIRETLLSPVDNEFGSHTSPNRDDGASETVAQARGRPLSMLSRSNSRANSRTNSRSNSLSCFGSRHGSSTKLVGLPDSKVSLSSTDIEGAIKLLQEAKRNKSPEDFAALRKWYFDSAIRMSIIQVEQLVIISAFKHPSFTTFKLSNSIHCSYTNFSDRGSYRRFKRARSATFRARIHSEEFRSQ